MQDITLVRLSKVLFVKPCVVPVLAAELFAKEAMGIGDMQFAISIVLKEKKS